MTQNATKVVIAGAGIAGLSAAVLCRRVGFEVEIWEKTTQDGGLLAPVDFCGLALDKGSHRIHPQADPLLLQLLERQQWLQRPRQGRLVLRQRHIPYPPRPLHFLRGLGLRTVADMGLGFLSRPGALRRFLRWESDRQQAPTQDEGFEQFVLARAGHAAYHHFYRPYVEKVWGETGANISRTVAKQRVSISQPTRALWRAFRHGSDKEGSFLYPKTGMAGLIAHVRSLALRQGVRFRYNTPISAANVDDIDASHILFGGQLDALAPGYGLHHKGLYLLYLAFPPGSLQEADTFYTPEAHYWFGRVSRPNAFSPLLQAAGKEILCVEIPEGRWGPQQNFCDKLEALSTQLHNAGILREPETPHDAKQHFLPRVYPMYRRGWLEGWQAAMDALRAYPRIMPIGRQGLFLHCNIDHCVRISQDAVAHIQAQRPTTQWLQHTQRYLDLRVRD